MTKEKRDLDESNTHKATIDSMQQSRINHKKISLGRMAFDEAAKESEGKKWRVN